VLTQCKLCIGGEHFGGRFQMQGFHASACMAGGREIRDVAGMRAAARDLRAKGAALVLVKGGHLAGANGRAAVDVACDGDGLEELESEVVRWRLSLDTALTLAQAIPLLNKAKRPEITIASSQEGVRPAK